MIALRVDDERGLAKGPLTILVVDDEALVRMALAEGFEEAGFRVVQAASANEALSVLRTSIAIDAVLTDIQMPGSMDGLQLAAAVRKIRPGLKIAVTSGHLVTRPSRRIADAFIAKPWAVETVVERVRKLIAP
jgi:CheY-like chemotaxis protein